MNKYAQVYVFLLLTLTFAACTKKETNTSQNQPANATSQQAASAPAPTAPSAAPAQPAASTPVQPAVSAKNTVPAPAAAAAQPAPAPLAKQTPPPAPAILPTGTTVTVQVAEAINTKTAKQGDTFSGTTTAPISVNGQVVIPKGARAEGVVVQSKSPGRFKGAGALSVRLTRLTVDGTAYHVSTTPDTLTANGKGKRTAVIAGGGTAGGALLGGLAGGGKGAAIGALLGAGAGGAGAGLTGNKELEIPAESALSFRLQKPLTLGPQTSESATE